MQHNRFNIFNQLHKGQRALLYHTALRIQQTDFADIDEGEETIKDIENTVCLCENHVQNEDNFILPAIALFDASVISIFEGEHAENKRLSHEIFCAAQAWKKAKTSGEKIAAGQNLFHCFTAFVAFSLYHMNKEEKHLNHALWKYFTDAEIRCIMNGIFAATPPEMLLINIRWMIRGLNNPELLEWLQHAKTETSLEVFQLLIDMADQELPAARWNNINTLLADAIMVI